MQTARGTDGGGAGPGPDGGFFVLIPAWNEAATIGAVVCEFRESGAPHGLRDVIVADNGSSDGTGEEAARAGAVVVDAARRGYGSACLEAISWCRRQSPHPDLVVFADGDGSDEPGDLSALVAPIRRGHADLVIGSRALGPREAGAVLPQARIGNWIASVWIRAASGVRFSDLGPYRAISWHALERLRMSDPNWGWTVEMQLKAARGGLRCLEVPVRSRRRRGGKSKVTGTVRGTVSASAKILSTLARYSTWQG